MLLFISLFIFSLAYVSSIPCEEGLNEAELIFRSLLKGPLANGFFGDVSNPDTPPPIYANVVTIDGCPESIKKLYNAAFNRHMEAGPEWPGLNCFLDPYQAKAEYADTLQKQKEYSHYCTRRLTAVLESQMKLLVAAGEAGEIDRPPEPGPVRSLESSSCPHELRSAFGEAMKALDFVIKPILQTAFFTPGTTSLRKKLRSRLLSQSPVGLLDECSIEGGYKNPMRLAWKAHSPMVSECSTPDVCWYAPIKFFRRIEKLLRRIALKTWIYEE